MAPLFILTETAAGYALLQAGKGKKLLKDEGFAAEASTAEGINGL